MRIVIAGGTGVIGRRLVPELLAAGHGVTGVARTDGAAAWLPSVGADPVVVDVLDRARLVEAVRAARPDAVVHQLTDLSARSSAANAALRVNGTRNLVDAALAAGVRRVVAQSIAFIYAPGRKPYKEGDPLDSSEAQRVTIAGVVALEDAVLHTPGIAGVVLRYGRLYGSGTWFDKPGGPGPLTCGAAAQAAVLALSRGAPGVYNVAEDDGEFSIDKARRELGFDPAFRVP